MSGRIKSLLTPFYKLAHPDVIRQAPEQVQKANSLALATLNSYIDSVVQGENVPLNSLRFYVPKKKEFTECKVTLLPLKSKAGQNIRDLHLESVVNSINQAITNPEETIEVSSQFDFPKRVRMKDQYFQHATDQIRNRLSNEARKERKNAILADITHGIEREHNPSHPSFFGLESRNSNFFMKQALKKTYAEEIYNLLQENLICIEKLFIDEGLTNEQTNEGLERLGGKNLTWKEMSDLRELGDKVQLEDIGMVISNRYSSTNVPGFFQIPYNFILDEMLSYYKNNQTTIVDRFSDYIKFSKKTDKILKSLSEIIVPCTLARYMYKNQQKYEIQTFEESYIACRNLMKIIEKNYFPRGLTDAVLVFGVEYHHESGLIQIPTNFTDRQLITFIQQIINEKKN